MNIASYVEVNFGQILISRWGILFMMKQAVLVTGAGGLLGSKVIEMLRFLNVDVIATDIKNPDLDCPFLAADFMDPSSVRALFDHPIGSIIHCGAISGPMLGRDDPAGTIRINVDGTVTLLEEVRKRRLGRFIYCGSIAAYGATGSLTGAGSVTTDAPLAAADIYGASKAAGEMMVRAYSHEHGVDACILRIGWVYGPKRRTRSLIYNLIRDALDGRQTVIAHDGKHAIQQVHVDDVARGLIRAWQANDIRGRVFNLTGGVRHTMRDIAALVASIVPQTRYQFTDGISYPDVEQSLFDITDTVQALDWKPGITLDAGIRSYADWLQTNEF
ncbi:MAG: NAD(P)-dependent oxidoreductase [Rhizobiales bacterium]|nr:NAD(P)-dependent oxidoreductase [Hyphomicrobiales bacterium]